MKSLIQNISMTVALETYELYIFFYNEDRSIRLRIIGIHSQQISNEQNPLPVHANAFQKQHLHVWWMEWDDSNKYM